MTSNQYDVIIIGTGLSGLAVASRLINDSKSIKIAIVTIGSGASAEIAALNSVMPSNPWGDSTEQYIKDMIKAGYYINDEVLVEKMCKETARCVNLLQDWGVTFATKEDKLLLRHASGSTYPRSLCSTSGLIGRQIIPRLLKNLEKKNVMFFYNNTCNKLLVDDGKIYGISKTDLNQEKCENIYAPVVVAAWGGVGNLFPDTTYPYDIDGRSLAMAFEAGASLIDLEFLEVEPMVTIWPIGAKGEPCPTAMLGEGAYLLNKDHERFMLKYRSTEAGSSKTLINKAIEKELLEGKGTPHGGVYVDLRHLPLSTLRAYPWFYNKEKDAGLDIKMDLLEVGPAAHSLSGGIMVGEDHCTNIQGFFAVGEAAGGIHGACRLGGNAATQAMVSGIFAAEKILGVDTIFTARSKIFNETYNRDKHVNNKNISIIKEVVRKTLGFYRDEVILEKGLSELNDIYESKTILKDEFTRQLALSGLLIAQSALLRTESRGVHNRRDFPNIDKRWQCSLKINRSPSGQIIWDKIPRSFLKIYY